MVTAIPFRRDFAFEYGLLEEIAPSIRRIIARNPSPFTFKGTGTYVIGRGKVAVIDPGPALAEHVDALLRSLEGETVTHILVTHTHSDHSPAAAAVKRRTGAPTYGFGPHGGAQSMPEPGGEEGADRDFVPDIALRDGDVVAGAGWRVEAVHTPGHTSNHLCFALAEEKVLFSGDHVMGWSTSVIVPPDGNMADYMASLEKLLVREERVFWPTHGPSIIEPEAHLRAFIAHRRERSEAILARLAAGDETIDAMVQAIYADIDPRLHGAAGRSVLAHLIELEAAGRVQRDGPPSRTARFKLRR